MNKEHIPAQIKSILIRAYNGHCAYCSDKAEHFDHMWPESKGGKTELFNMMPLCQFHNLSKGVKEPTASLFEFHKVMLKAIGIIIPQAYVVGNPYVVFDAPALARMAICQGLTNPELGCKIKLNDNVLTVRQFLAYIESNETWTLERVKRLIKGIIFVKRRNYKTAEKIWGKLVEVTEMPVNSVRSKAIRLGLYKQGEFMLELV